MKPRKLKLYHVDFLPKELAQYPRKLEGKEGCMGAKSLNEVRHNRYLLHYAGTKHLVVPRRIYFTKKYCYETSEDHKRVERQPLKLALGL